MKSTDYANLSAFIAIVETGSFRKAASRLDLKPSTLSHGIRSLEERLGVLLLHRTTRTVSPTEAGQALYAQVAPAFAAVAQAVEDTNRFRSRPCGTVRLSVPRSAAERVLAPRFRAFADHCPGVRLEISADNAFIDIVKAGFDAGIRLGESVEKDMVAVRITPDFRAAVVGSPDYFNRFPKPASPHDLTAHHCIGRRRISGGGLYRWEFARNGQVLEVAVGGPLVLDDDSLALQAALDGVGLAYSADAFCAGHLRSGRLVRVLEDWCPPYPGFFLYYPDRRASAALKALVDMLRLA
ncbi:MAG: LysR family transcriptional regulator [Lautropia sp.]|nr:LysR family transcriptional regulator [Lautropia sp.]